jgi:glycosyltransferase involved in cell wall biosynthesis
MQSNGVAVFWMHAYNAEKTIRRAIDSILCQTCGDFVFYCLDNGSTDRTGTIIDEYAGKDSRMIPIHRSENIRGALGVYLPQLFSCDDNRYMAVLDADDEYAPDFLDKMQRFVNENALDVAMCGTEYIEENGESVLATPNQTLLFDSANITGHLPDFYRFTKRLWAGLYNISILMKAVDYTVDIELTGAIFIDSIWCLRTFALAARSGVYAENLHKYHILSEQAVSAMYTPYWFLWVKTLTEHLREFLLGYGNISPQNESFINIQFFVWLKYILPRLQHSAVNLETKLRDMRDIFTDEKTTRLLRSDWREIGIQTDKREFLIGIINWLNGQSLETLNEMQVFGDLMQIINSTFAPEKSTRTKTASGFEAK